jgi:hypothetical protein
VIRSQRRCRAFGQRIWTHAATYTVVAELKTRSSGTGTRRKHILDLNVNGHAQPFWQTVSPLLQVCLGFWGSLISTCSDSSLRPQGQRRRGHRRDNMDRWSPHTRLRSTSYDWLAHYYLESPLRRNGRSSSPTLRKQSPESTQCGWQVASLGPWLAMISAASPARHSSTRSAAPAVPSGNRAPGRRCSWSRGWCELVLLAGVSSCSSTEHPMDPAFVAGLWHADRSGVSTDRAGW